MYRNFVILQTVDIDFISFFIFVISDLSIVYLFISFFISVIQRMITIVVIVIIKAMLLARYTVFHRGLWFTWSPLLLTNH